MHRLTCAAEFEPLLKSRVFARNATFALHLRPNQREHWRLGLVVPKRFARMAVERNYIKRVWRELFRQARNQLEISTGNAESYDLVVRFLPKQHNKQQQITPVVKVNHFNKRKYFRDEAEALLQELLFKISTRV